MIRVWYNYTVSGYVDVESDNVIDAEDKFNEKLQNGEIDFSADEVIETPYVVRLDDLNTRHKSTKKR